MNVIVKDFYVSMELKANGMELGVYTPDDGKHLGDCFVTMVGLIWCDGKVVRENGIHVKWQDLMEICQSDDTVKTALKAVKAAKPVKVTKTVI
jgi:hypothetical protein